MLVGKGKQELKQAGLTKAKEILQLAQHRICFICSGDVAKKDGQHYVVCARGCKGGAYYNNDPEIALVDRLVDGLRFHFMKQELLGGIDECIGSTIPCLVYQNWGKSKATLYCTKCNATINKMFVQEHTSIYLDWMGTNSYPSTYRESNDLDFDDSA